MSVTVFDLEPSEIERCAKQLNQELESEITPGMSYLQKVRLARKKMSEIKKACQAKGWAATSDEDGKVFIPDFDDLRKSMKNRIIKRAVSDKSPSLVNQDQGSMANKSMSKNSKARLSSIKEYTPNNSGRKSKARKLKDDTKKFSVFQGSFLDVKAMEEEKKRNSAIVQGFAERIFGARNQLEVPKQDKFGLDMLGQVPGGNMAPRDSIDVQSINLQHRPSTLLQMRNSTFKFDTSLAVNDCLGEEEVNIDEIVSDLSDCDIEPELIDGEEEQEDLKKEKALKVQFMQADGKFLQAKSHYVINMTGYFDEDKTDSTKFAQRVKVQDGQQGESAASLMVVRNRIVKEGFAFLDDCTYDVYLREVDSDDPGQENSLSVVKLKEKEGALQEEPKREQIKKVLGSATSCCYTNVSSPDTYLSLSTSNHSIFSLRVYPEFINKYFVKEGVLDVSSTEDGALSVTTHNLPVFLGYEFTRSRSPIVLAPGNEFFFNKVDGIRVEGILPAGFTDEEFEAFKPKTNSWDIECLNRNLSDHSVYKYFLLANMKNSEKKEVELLDKAVRECFDCPKNLARIMKFKKEYFSKLAKKSRQAVLKLSVIRQYDVLSLKKKISEVLVFLADPFEHGAPEESDQKLTMKDKLKQIFLGKKNVIQVGKSVQLKLPVIRNEFERSNLFYAIDLNFDLEVGYTRENHQFFLRMTEETQESSDTYEEVSNAVPLEALDLRSIMGDSVPEYKLNEPREGIWIALPKNSTVMVSDKSLLCYDTSVVRVFSDKVNLI